MCIILLQTFRPQEVSLNLMVNCSINHYVSIQSPKLGTKLRSSRTQHTHIPSKTGAYNEELKDPKSQCEQIRDLLDQVSSENQELVELLSKYVGQLDEQEFYRKVLEMDLDQHKEVLADAIRELAKKGYLLSLARDEVQHLANANAEKDRIISALRVQSD